MIDERTKKEITARLSSKKPLKVILFGSGAWGYFDEETDIDLFRERFIEMDSGFSREVQEKGLLLI
jgi:predicted nucleotidyltransferase